MKITELEYAKRIKWTLHQKIDHSLGVIDEYYSKNNGKVYVSFSGGKDSTVLLWLARKIFPDIKGVFMDTGLEYPEIRNFVKTFDNIDWVKPKMNFKQVVEKHGYPVVSKTQSLYTDEIRNSKSDKLKRKRIKDKTFCISNKWSYLLHAPFKISPKCCDELKKKPVKIYENTNKVSAIVGTMATESRQRKLTYLNHGCNSFDSKRKMSRPLSIWNEADIWKCIKEFNMPYSDIYNMGYQRTGCMFCLFGIHLEKEPNRLQRMQITHPQLYKYCMENLGIKEVVKYMGTPYENKNMQIKLFTESR